MWSITSSAASCDNVSWTFVESNTFEIYVFCEILQVREVLPVFHVRSPCYHWQSWIHQRLRGRNRIVNDRRRRRRRNRWRRLSCVKRFKRCGGCCWRWWWRWHNAFAHSFSKMFSGRKKILSNSSFFEQKNAVFSAKTSLLFAPRTFSACEKWTASFIARAATLCLRTRRTANAISPHVSRARVRVQFRKVLVDTIAMSSVGPNVLVDSEQHFVMCFNARNALPVEVKMFCFWCRHLKTLLSISWVTVLRLPNEMHYVRCHRALVIIQAPTNCVKLKE